MDMEGLISWTKIETKMGDRIGDHVVMLVLYHWIGNVLALIKDHMLMPIWFFLSNYRCASEDLRTQLEKMRNDGLEVRGLVDDAIRNGEAVLPRVQRWLESVDQTWYDSVYCLNLYLDWRRIMHVKEIKATVGKITRKGKSIDIVSISKSKMSIFRDVMGALKDNKIKRIALYGERRVGKTTLAKEIGIEALDTDLFKEVVTVTSLDQRNIKYEIADQLGLKFPEMYLEKGKAEWLLKILEEKTSILVILDNVQAKVIWEDAGIPHREQRYNGCKILLVSSNQDVCVQSGADRIKFLN